MLSIFQYLVKLEVKKCGKRVGIQTFFYLTKNNINIVFKSIPFFVEKFNLKKKIRG